MAKVLVFMSSRDVLDAYGLQAELMLGGQHAVKLETDIKEALRQIGCWQPDVIVADYAWVDGGWLCREVKKLRPPYNVPVILTGPQQELTQTWQVEHLLRTQHGCNDYVPRPVSAEKLGQLVDLYVCVNNVKRSLAEAAEGD